MSKKLIVISGEGKRKARRQKPRFTKAALAEISDCLQNALGEVVSAMRQMCGDLRVRDIADKMAGVGFDPMVNRSRLSALMAEHQQITSALALVAKGTYGICAECGEPISDPRLEAIPYALDCIGCRELREAEFVRVARRR